MAKTCCYPGCNSLVSGSHLVCVQHWLGVPAEIRHEVQVRLRGWKDRAAAYELLLSFFKKQKGTR